MSCLPCAIFVPLLPHWRQIVLDRIGLGPHSSQELSVGLSLVEQWAAELDALGEQATLDGDSA